MALLDLTPSALPPDALEHLTRAVAAATAPDRLQGRNPYHYTFWYPLELQPRNVVEAAVREHLVQHVPAEVRAAAVGVEWWLGRLAPPYASNFEFGLHKDFGVNPQTGALESPMLSSVIYLTEVADGPLVVFGGQPTLDADDVQAAVAAYRNREYVFPAENLFAKFPGHLWHAVLSRRDVRDDPPAVPESRVRLTVLMNWWAFQPSDIATKPMKMVAADFDGSVYPELVA